MREAEITGRLEHPGIVPVYGLGRYPDGRPFYAMRFIQGENLKEAIERFHEAEASGRDPGERILALRKLLRRFLDVCNAVDYAHSRGVLHRDLKPANIMLGPYGETLVVDWGLAKPSIGPTRRSPSRPGRHARVGPDRLRPLTKTGVGAGHARLHEPGAGGGPLERGGPGQRRVQPGGDALHPPVGPLTVRRPGRRVPPLGRPRRQSPAAPDGQAGVLRLRPWRRSA